MGFGIYSDCIDIWLFHNHLVTKKSPNINFRFCYLQFHPSLGLNPLGQMQNPSHGNLFVLQEKFDIIDAKSPDKLQFCLCSL